MTGHKGLPWPTLQQVADADGSAPPAEVEAAIVAAAAKVQEEIGLPAPGGGSVDAYWVHAEVHQIHPDVTIGQVARVLLERGLAQ